jgi:hypothetical protein
MSAVNAGPAARATDSTDWRTAWSAALDAVEADIDQIEKLLADEHRLRDLPLIDPWRPPAGLGPLPLDLRPRADAVLARQLAAAQALTAAMTMNRRQIAFLAKVEAGDAGNVPPSYLDFAV